VDPWETFVLSSFRFDSGLLIPSFLVAGSGKSVIWFVNLKSVPSVAIDVSCQFHSDPGY
jgi:hypothetical protein